MRPVENAHAKITSFMTFMIMTTICTSILHNKRKTTKMKGNLVFRLIGIYFQEYLYKVVCMKILSETKK